jgi:hypothetical protein
MWSSGPGARPPSPFRPPKVAVEDISGTDLTPKRESRVRIQSPYLRSRSACNVPLSHVEVPSVNLRPRRPGDDPGPPLVGLLRSRCGRPTGLGRRVAPRPSGQEARYGTDPDAPGAPSLRSPRGVPMTDQKTVTAKPPAALSIQAETRAPRNL